MQTHVWMSLGGNDFMSPSETPAAPGGSSGACAISKDHLLARFRPMVTKALAARTSTGNDNAKFILTGYCEFSLLKGERRGLGTHRGIVCPVLSLRLFPLPLSKAFRRALVHVEAPPSTRTSSRTSTRPSWQRTPTTSSTSTFGRDASDLAMLPTRIQSSSQT